jgi:hypothetical protein
MGQGGFDFVGVTDLGLLWDLQGFALSELIFFVSRPFSLFSSFSLFRFLPFYVYPNRFTTY